MRAFLITYFTYCALHLAQSEENHVVNQNLGSLHIHLNTTKLPYSPHLKRWVDKHATQKAISLVNYVKSLPKLNPFKAASFGPYDATIPDYGNITFGNVIVTGINDLFIQNVEVQLAPARIDVNASIPRITIEADFDLEVDYSHLPIHDRGHLYVTLMDLDITAAIGSKASQTFTDSVYQLETADFSVDLKDIQILIDMDKYADEFSVILNQFAKNTEELIVDNDVLDTILKVINKELEKIPAKKIVQFLLGASQPQNLKQWNSQAGRKRRVGRRYGK